MALKTDPLLADYAVVAGARIEENVAKVGVQLLDKVKQRYETWSGANRKLAESRQHFRGDLRALDGALDRAVSVPANITQAILDGYADPVAPLDEEQRQRFDDALAVQAVFGGDLRAITALPYPQEWARVKDVLQAMTQGDLAPAVQRLGLTPDVRRIAVLHQFYGERLGITGTDHKHEGALALLNWNQAFHELLIAVAFFRYEQPEIAPLIEEPYQAQLAAQRKAAAEERKRAARKPDPA